MSSIKAKQTTKPANVQTKVESKVQSKVQPRVESKVESKSNSHEDSSSIRDTQLSDMLTFDVSNIIFNDVRECDVPSAPGTKAMKYKRINISVLNPDGSVGDFVVKTEPLFSFGLSENIDSKSNILTGYSLPLCLWTKDKATENEKQWTTKFDEIIEYTKEHLLSIKQELKKPELEMRDLKKLNPLYWKKNETDGSIVPGLGPTLYSKLITSKKANRDDTVNPDGLAIITKFYDMDDNPVDPLTLKKRYCSVIAAVKFESIYISGEKYAMQIKLYEAQVKPLGGAPKALLPRPQHVNKQVNFDPDNNTDPDYDNTTTTVTSTQAPSLSRTENTPSLFSKNKFDAGDSVADEDILLDDTDSNTAQSVPASPPKTSAQKPRKTFAKIVRK